MAKEIRVDLCPNGHGGVVKSAHVSDQGQREVSNAALKAGFERGVAAVGGGKDANGGSGGGAGLSGR
jgi:hypothetical protein